MTGDGFSLELLREPYFVERHPAGHAPADGDATLALLRTRDAVTVVRAADAPSGRAERSTGPWRCLRVDGPFAHDVVGVLAALSEALAGADVPLFALSEFDTDYLLVPADRAEDACRALERAGHRVRRP